VQLTDQHPKGLPLYLPPRPRCSNNRYPSTSPFHITPLTSILIGNFALLPLRTRTRGPAYTLPPLPAGTSDLDIDPDSESYDPLDEVLSLFRANTFFRNFEIKGPADRLLIYGILFVSECLTKIKPTMGAREAEKVGLLR
jgi:ARP2/3 complex ARPC3 (21 kDa) subunit